MAKKKNALGLFEVISKNRDRNPDSEVTVPDWVKHPGQSGQEAQAPAVQEPAAGEPASPEAETETPAARDEVSASQAQAASAPVLPTTSTRTPRRPVETPKISDLPIWSTAGGRLTLSLNYVSCLVASMGVLLLIIAAFVLGRATAPDASPPATVKQPVVKRQPGKYYMVIETLADESDAAEAEANQIVKFCGANGEPAQVQLLPKIVNGKIVKGKGKLIVWSLTPFDSKTSEEVNAHARHVQNELGAKYAKTYGSKYSFNQTRKGKLAPVMFQYKKTP